MNATDDSLTDAERHRFEPIDLGILQRAHRQHVLPLLQLSWRGEKTKCEGECAGKQRRTTGKNGMTFAAAQQADHSNMKPKASERPTAALKAKDGTAGRLRQRRPPQALQATTKTSHTAARQADGGQKMEPR